MTKILERASPNGSLCGKIFEGNKLTKVISVPVKEETLLDDLPTIIILTIIPRDVVWRNIPKTSDLSRAAPDMQGSSPTRDV